MKEIFTVVAIILLLASLMVFGIPHCRDDQVMVRGVFGFECVAR